MTEKRFKVHSMIRGMDIGETMDLEVCEELIKKYGSSSDIDLLITNNGNNMTYKEVADLLNENEQLKQQLRNSVELFRKDSVTLFELKEENKELKVNYKELRYANNIYCNKIDSLKKEIEQLKKQLESREKAHTRCDELYWKLYDENEQLKKELKIYNMIATCSNCKYQDYDWFEDGDEFEICKKGNNNQQIEYHICKEWEEF